MFKMGCSMARKILGPGSGNEQPQQPGNGGSGDRKRGGGGAGASENNLAASGNAGGNASKSADELGDFSKLEEDPRLPLNVRQIFKITKSWKAIARTMSKTGTAMFLNLFEQNQDLFYLFDRFQHLKGRELHESMELREHAATVMATLDQSINSLSDYDNFVAYLHSIGQLHRKIPGFKREYFWKIEQPFMKAVKQTLDERCNETIEQIYVIAIKLIIETIAAGYGQEGEGAPATAAAPLKRDGDSAKDNAGAGAGGGGGGGGASASSGGAAPPRANENNGNGKQQQQRAGGQQRAAGVQVAACGAQPAAASLECPRAAVELKRVKMMIASGGGGEKAVECARVDGGDDDEQDEGDRRLVGATCALLRTTSSLLVGLGARDSETRDDARPTQWGRVLGELSATLMMAEGDDNQAAASEAPFSGAQRACEPEAAAGVRSAARANGAIRATRRANTDRRAPDAEKAQADEAPRGSGGAACGIANAARQGEAAVAVASKTKAKAKARESHECPPAAEEREQFNDPTIGHERRRPSQRDEQQQQKAPECPQTPPITAARHAAAAGAGLPRAHEIINSSCPAAAAAAAARTSAAGGGAGAATSTSKSNWKSNLAQGDGAATRKLQVLCSQANSGAPIVRRPTAAPHFGSTGLTGDCVMARRAARLGRRASAASARSGCNDNNNGPTTTTTTTTAEGAAPPQVTGAPARQPCRLGPDEGRELAAPRDHERATSGAELIKSAGWPLAGGNCAAPTRHHASAGGQRWQLADGDCKQSWLKSTAAAAAAAAAASNQNQGNRAPAAGERQSRNNNKPEITTPTPPTTLAQAAMTANWPRPLELDCATDGGPCNQDSVVSAKTGAERESSAVDDHDERQSQNGNLPNDSSEANAEAKSALHKSELAIMDLLNRQAGRRGQTTDEGLAELIKVLLLINRLSLTLAADKRRRRQQQQQPVNDIESRLTSARQELTVES